MTADLSRVLDELDALEAKATEGPWGCELSDSLHSGEDCYVIECPDLGIAEMQGPKDTNEPNGKFIAALRNNYKLLRDALRKEADRE